MKWQAVGVGTFVGLGPIALVLIWKKELFERMWGFGWTGWLFAPSAFLVPFIGAVIGAVIGGQKKSLVAVWIGSILGLVFGIITEVGIIYMVILSLT